MKKILCIACVVVAFAAGRAAATDSGGTQSPFALGVGARALAMGGTGVAQSRDATALFWNPARLAAASQAELSLFRTQLFVDGALYHAGFLAYPTLDFGTLAVGYQRLGVSDIERRDDRNQLLGTFDDGESNLLFGYGRNFGSALALGTSVRVLQQSVDAVSDVGIGLDLGVAWERGFGAGETQRVSLGANVRNALEPRVRLRDDEVSDPRVLVLGAGYGGGRDGRFAWNAAADVQFPARADARLGIGAEIVYLNVLALRGGVDAGHPTLGLGLAWRGIAFDYALRADDELSRNDRFTLAVRLGRPVEDRREERRATRERAVVDRLAQLLQERESLQHARIVAQADSAFGAQRWDDALRLYRRAQALAPDDSSVARRAEITEQRLALTDAATQLAGGQFAQAAATFQSILERWPELPEAVEGSTSAHAQLQGAADRQQQLDALLRGAMTKLADEDLRGAESDLTELLRLQPDHALGTELQARVMAARQARGRADLDRARTLATTGDFTSALERLAAARELLGDSKEFASLQRDWSQARSKPPAREDTAPTPRPIGNAAVPEPPRRIVLSAHQRRQLDRQYQTGLSAFESGDFEHAIREWRAVWSVDPHFEQVDDHLVQAYLYEGIALYSNGRYAEAIERCRRVLEIDPANDKALRYLDRISEEKTELERIEGGRR